MCLVFLSRICLSGWAVQDAARETQRTATIHWQGVPLRDALERLESLFADTIFLDRRVDPTQRVSLDIQASSSEEVLTAVGAGRELAVTRLGSLVYLGPRGAAQRLSAVAEMRAADVERLARDRQSSLQRERRLTWPRLTEPRGLATSLAQQRGWRVEGAERIPHDLWPAGGLPGLSLAEQLTVLLIGFDLTFEIRPGERIVAIVPLTGELIEATPQAADHSPAAPRRKPSLRRTKRVYTLRVAEQPVGAVLRELSKRLNWAIDVDESSIRAAGRSLNERVSFVVENVEQDELLESLLRPAGLDFRREGERIKIIAREDASE